MSLSKNIQNPISLYRHLYRSIKKLPPGVQSYYHHFIRQQYNSHTDETDQKRIKDIMEQSLKDLEWLLKKYGIQK